MSYARRFDGSNDELRTSIGSCNLTGAFTVAALARRQRAQSQGVADLVFSNYTSAGFITNVRLGFSDSDTVVVGANEGTTTVDSFEWVLLAGTKGAGTVTPRVHVYQNGGWTHENAGGTLADAASQAGGSVRFAAISGFSYYQVDVAVAGEWNRVLSDFEIEELSEHFASDDWLNLSPVGMWPFNQASVTTDVVDLIGDADQTSRTETSVVTDGPEWNYDPLTYFYYRTSPIVETVDSEGGLMIDVAMVPDV